ncbi:hypothetical protein [Clostridium sp.]|uniref:hypothetical protein n=1 Tax=Clostridium sp. TaxID=1506 RepID=UPI0006C6F739|nr:hypothetical protein [Clostridium sp.]CUQ43170.1 Uncharacterised protein [Clostridium paraputrificum]MDU1842110.1 hypothetical protein [Clostridium sp.]MDU2703186.1 hypothetical protein [Clostridium sp.]MDU3149257.1 hypothetical protein [Clostridium sp.]MDU5601470.1 hypothetical protein [Clostridium sp.]
MIRVRQNYNSFKYWESLIHENKTIRGHMFMDNPPKEKSLYIHTLIFSKNNGIDNIYAYFPDAKVLLGYIQYSFLQEAFYKWIYGKDRIIINIPSLPVDKIIRDGLSKGKISKSEAQLMLSHYTRVSKMWDLPKDRVIPELIKFSREFNKTWYGDNKEFLYLKIFRNPEELGNFIVDSTMLTNDENTFISKTGVTVSEWKKICSEAIKNKLSAEKFKEILQKNLSEVI